MNGVEVRTARRARGLTQRDLAAKLGVSQGYVSLLERNQRAMPAPLAAKLASVLKMSAAKLPVSESRSLNTDQMARALGALGYEAFGYLTRGRRLNPAEVLLGVLRTDDVDARVVEALPWLVVQFSDLDWDWVVRFAKQDDLQNRLGFVLSLGNGLAEALRDSKAATVLAQWEQRLEKSRLQGEDSFARRTLTNAEVQWLRSHRSPEARRWNVLSTLSVQTIQRANQIAV
jgi:transcriptional regulator with XRE-family HTH domain